MEAATIRAGGVVTAVALKARDCLEREANRPLILCAWERVLMVHYEVGAEVLRPHVPFELDLYEGMAYVSLVMFEMSGMRTGKCGGFFENVKLFPRHRFLNLRTYVRHEGERGIYFLSEWVSNALAVKLGPVLYGLPYRKGDVAYEHGDETALRGEVVGDGRLSYVARVGDGEFATCEPASLDEFLMERYVAFTARHGLRRRFRVAHGPWPMKAADVVVHNDSLLRRAAAWFDRARLVGANYSKGVFDVWIGMPARVGADISNMMAVWGWLPLLGMVGGTVALRPHLAGWAFMWTMAAALFAGCKIKTLWDARDAVKRAGLARVVAYLFAWVGTDARAFLERRREVNGPRGYEWVAPVVKLGVGATLVLGGGVVAPWSEFAAAWVGMIGLVLCLHLGAFHLLALAWRVAGVDARPIMDRPATSASLAEFWGRRWNAGFRDLTHRYVFKSAARRWGVGVATGVAFFLSGLVHELVISLPAGAGYGLPTIYFVAQGAGVMLERSNLGKRLGLASGWKGWLFTAAVTAGPAYWLFHPAFVERVAVPMFKAIGVF